MNLSSIPLGNTKIMINDTIAVTDSNGRFQVAKDDNKEVQLLSMNIDDDFIIISKEGFNDYKTYNWKNGTNVYLRPYLSVVRLCMNTVIIHINMLLHFCWRMTMILQ